mgnify:CR=1 FL=1
MKNLKNLLLLMLMAFSMTAVSQNGILLKLDLQPGATYKMTNRLKNEVSQTIMGVEQEIAEEVTQYMTYQVLGTKADGNIAIQLTFDRVIFVSNQLTGESRYDSDDTDDPADPQAQRYAAIIDIPFQLEMTKTGEIVKFQGMESAVEGVIEKENITDPAKKERIRKSLGDLFSRETLAEQLSLSILFPEERVAIGDSWSKEKEVNSGPFPIMTKTTYTVNEINAMDVIIDVTSIISTTGSTSVSSSDGMTMKADLRGEQIGQIIIDKNSGWLTNSNLDKNMDGTVTVEPSEELPEGFSWPMKIVSSLTSEPTAQ